MRRTLRIEAVLFLHKPNRIVLFPEKGLIEHPLHADAFSEVFFVLDLRAEFLPEPIADACGIEFVKKLGEQSGKSAKRFRWNAPLARRYADGVCAEAAAQAVGALA